jgi:hypothetical protein
MTRFTVDLYRKAKSTQAIRFAWALFLGLLALIACAMPTSSTELDEVAIYAAVIRRIYLEDDTFGGTLQPPTLYLVRTTDDGVGDPEEERSAPNRLPEGVQREIAEALDGLPTEIVWVDHRDRVPQDQTRGIVANGGAIITVGNLHPQQDGSVHVSGSIYVGMLAAGGQTYVVERVNGVWEVTGTTGVQWIS